MQCRWISMFFCRVRSPIEPVLGPFGPACRTGRERALQKIVNNPNCTFRVKGLAWLNMLCHAAALIILLGHAVPARAAQVALDQLVEEALKANPEVQAARSRARAAGYRPAQAGFLPNPSLMVEVTNSGTKRWTIGEDPMSNVMFSLRQQIPFPGKLVSMKRAEGFAARGMEIAQRIAELNAVASVKGSFHELYYLDRAIMEHRKNRVLLEDYLKIASEKYAGGRGIQQDVLKAQLEVSMMDERLAGYESMRSAREGELNRLLNRPVTSPVGEIPEIIPGVLSKTLEDLLASAGKESPKIALARAEVSRGEKALSATRMGYAPDIELSAGYGYRKSLDGMWTAGAGLVLPIYFFVREFNAVDEAKGNLEASRSDETAVVNEVLSQAREAYASIRAAEKLIKLYDSAVIPQAEASHESAVSGYRVGKMEFKEVLDCLSAVLTYRVERARQVAERGKALARIEAITGVNLSDTEVRGK
jgi:cobalt-zinc-cadmium efflux system outer membrane protein